MKTARGSRACDYYGVTADYLLCRTEEPNAETSVRRAAMSFLEQIRTVADRAEMALEIRPTEEGRA